MADVFQEAIGSLMEPPEKKERETIIVERRKRKKGKMTRTIIRENKQPGYELNPVLKQTGKLLKRGIFGPSEEEKLFKTRARLKGMQARIETKKLEQQLRELEEKNPKPKGLIDKILKR